MLCKEDAHSKVQFEISKDSGGEELVVLVDATQEYDWGWVVFYNSRQYAETGEHSSALAGNCPYIVNKLTGELLVTGTALPIESYVADYELQLQQLPGSDA